MTKGRLTTLDGRIESVSYCIDKGEDWCSNREARDLLPADIYGLRKHEIKGIDDLSPVARKYCIGS